MPRATRNPRPIVRRVAALAAVTALALVPSVGGCTCADHHPEEGVSVETLLREMVDLEELAREPRPFFKEAASTSYDRASHEGGAEWFSNADFDQFVRTEENHGRKEHVLADLVGPGTMTRFWTANSELHDRLRFYFDGETEARLSCTMADLFDGRVDPIGPDFGYTVSGGGDVYFPLPYAHSLKITQEEDRDREETIIYYQIGYRTYDAGTRVESYDPRNVERWRPVLAAVSSAFSHPSGGASFWTEWVTERLTVPPGETRDIRVQGEKSVFDWSARVLGTHESPRWDDPSRAHNAYRFLLLGIDFDGEKSVLAPLGDFFGSGPGVNPFQNLLFTVEANGRMTSRLRMPFHESMTLSLTNAGQIPYTVDVRLHVGKHAFTSRDWHLRAQWGTLTHDTWPPFDMTFLAKKGEGKVVGTVYEIANPVLVWWGEGDQKVFVDGEPFPSTFGTGTEDDYGWAYARGDLFGRPYHAQTRVDGPRNGGHVTMNRMYVLDALPYRKQIRFDEEVLHWVPCQPTWSHVVYWYAKPGTQGPTGIDRSTLAPANLGRPEDMLTFEAETLEHEVTGGEPRVEEMINTSDRHHLVWVNAKPGDKLTVHFSVPKAGRYLVQISLSQSIWHGRRRFSVDGQPAEPAIDDYATEVPGYSSPLRWQQPSLGVFELREGDNTIEAETLEPNPSARGGNVFGLDYIVLTRQ